MMKNARLSELIDTEKSWCFLTLKVIKNNDEVTIAGWEVRFADDNQIFYTAECDDVPDQKKIIRQLLCYLGIARKHRMPVITFRNDAIPIVRTMLLLHDIRINLRDLKIISLQKILQEHFYIDSKTSVLTASVFALNMNFKLDDIKGTTLVRDIFLRIKSLLPADVIT